MTPRIRQEDIRDSIISSVNVTLQQVTIAKAFILKNFTEDTQAVIRNLVSAMKFSYPDKIDFNHNSKSENQTKIKNAVESLSWIRAGCEAVWSLISSGLLIPQGNTSISPIPHLQYSIQDSSGGESSGWDLNCLKIEVPKKILLPLSMADQNRQLLTDPDLYLHSIDIPGLKQQVGTSLREAVRCFRNDLFVACLAMLGRASEGAWIELGLGLVSTVPSNSPLQPDNIRDNLESPFIGIGKKIKDVIELYEHKEVFGVIQKKSKVKVQDLKNVVIWADSVRESRNSIHYGVESALPNNYEKVAALLIAAVSHFRVIYRIFAETEQRAAIDAAAQRE
jgi:hypothetical protein